MAENASNKIFTGARAIFQIGKTGETAKTVGIFSEVNYGLSYGTSPAYVLGRYEAVEIAYTDQGTVNVDASGWRVIGNGPHVAASLPYLKELLTEPYMQLQLVDRQTGQTIMLVKDVRVVGYSTGSSSRSTSTIRVSFVGRVISDENTSVTDKGGVTTDGLVDDSGTIQNSDPFKAV